MKYNKRWQVAKLFHGEEITNAKPPNDSDWYSWDDIAKGKFKNKKDPGSTLLLWAKDNTGKAFLVFAFKEDASICSANNGEFARGITHFARIPSANDVQDSAAERKGEGHPESPLPDCNSDPNPLE